MIHLEISKHKSDPKLTKTEPFVGGLKRPRYSDRCMSEFWDLGFPLSAAKKYDELLTCPYDDDNQQLNPRVYTTYYTGSVTMATLEMPYPGEPDEILNHHPRRLHKFAQRSRNGIKSP